MQKTYFFRQKTISKIQVASGHPVVPTRTVPPEIIDANCSLVSVVPDFLYLHKISKQRVFFKIWGRSEA